MDEEDDSSCSFIDNREAEFELWLRDPEFAGQLQCQQMEEIISYWVNWHRFGDKLLPY